MAVHHSKEKAGSLPVVTIPLILYCDDTSGNRSKKWNGFNLWCFLLAGLGKASNAKLKNIHFITCSNAVTPMEMAQPIVADLQVLAREGIVAYDAHYKQEVLVYAPLLCLLADNPRASELLNHMGSAARHYCRICEVKHMTHACIMNKSCHVFTRLTRKQVLNVWVHLGTKLLHWSILEISQQQQPRLPKVNYNVNVDSEKEQII